MVQEKTSNNGVWYVYTDGLFRNLFTDHEPFEKFGMVVQWDYETEEGMGIARGELSACHARFERDRTKYEAFAKHFPSVSTFVIEITDIIKDNQEEMDRLFNISDYITKFMKENNLIPDQFTDYEVVK